MADIDYYKILGVSKDATVSQIKARYQLLAKKYHPDHDGDDSVMSLINEAYQVLSNPQKKYQYDHKDDQPKATTSSTNYSQRQQTNYTQSTYQSTKNSQSRTYTQTKSQQEIKKKNEQLNLAKRQRRVVKYPYVWPSIFGLLMISIGLSSPYTNRFNLIVWTAITMGIFSYLLQRLVIYSVKKDKNRTITVFFNQKDERSGIIGIVVTTVVILMIAVISFHSAISKNSTSANVVTPAQVVIDSKNQYYAPKNASSFTVADETAIANSCMSQQGSSNYSSATMVRYCGCVLGTIEQNYTPDEIKKDYSNGYSTALETQSQNTINKYCNSLL